MFWNAGFRQPPVHVNDFNTESYKFLTVVSHIYLHLLGSFPLSQHTTPHNVSENTRFHLQASNTNITDKTYFNIISFKGSLREQHHWCTRTALWSPQYRLRLYGIDGRMTSEWLVLKYLDGHSRGLIEILSANLLGGNEENRETRQNAGPRFEPDISRMQVYHVTFRILLTRGMGYLKRLSVAQLGSAEWDRMIGEWWKGTDFAYFEMPSHV
jgi:hypothetical protein